MDGYPSFRREGGQNPAYRSTHRPLRTTPHTKDCYVLNLPYRELPLEDPGTPDTRSPVRFLLWLGKNQWRLVLGAVVFGVGWMLAQALLWAAVGQAIDKGISPQDSGQLWKWVGVVIALGIIQGFCGAMRHQMAVTNWMMATYRSIQLVGHHVSRNGSAVIDEIPSGDVVQTVGADVFRIGGAFDVIGRFIGAIVAWVVVSFILLSSSVQLGLVVLVGVPLLATLTLPLMKPLHSTQAAQREAAGRLAALGSDTVVGLRILRGIGGEEVFRNNYNAQSQLVRFSGNRIAGPQAGLESGQLLLPAILVAIITYIGGHDVANGSLQPGQLVAFFGYATFLTTPLRTVIEYILASTRAIVGSRKLLRILNTHSTLIDPAEPAAWPISVETMSDSLSGITVRRGQLTALVTETPTEATVVADRLGRFVADAPGVRINDLAIENFAVAVTRQHVVVAEIEPTLFSGTLRDELQPAGIASDEQLLTALRAASALDILDAVADGLDSIVEERGRSFSGGQRQRVALARAFLTNADVLILVEPTSAVDSHTESRIATSLKSIRGDLTTLIATTSPLLLEKVDQVVALRDGRVVEVGTHRELLGRSAWYRELIVREVN